MRVPIIKFHENQPTGIRADTRGQTERHNEAYRLFKLPKTRLKTNANMNFALPNYNKRSCDKYVKLLCGRILHFPPGLPDTMLTSLRMSITKHN